MSYALWDAEAASAIGFYPTRDAALAIVRRSMMLYGTASVRFVGLEEIDAHGDAVVVAYGEALVELVRATATVPSDSTR